MSSSALLYEPGHVLEGTVYRVIRHLATGGMGSVYDVEDVTVEKRYVLKTLHPELVEREDLARRMRDEARSLARLHHPNIVEVITAGVTTDAAKMPFYVMERLIGQNLRVVLGKRGALDAAHAYRIGVEVADALEHAHEHQLVHRDVKPENIFLHRAVSGATTTKLLDFGIVRLLDRKASHTHGKFVGTLRYASPEQIVGQPIGPATDIYSLGTVLYEMLCGRGPFDEAGDQYAISAAHVKEPPPPMARFARVGPEIERLVASMLAKAPEDRPRGCAVVVAELRRLLRDGDASAPSATAMDVLRGPVPVPAPGASGLAETVHAPARANSAHEAPTRAEGAPPEEGEPSTRVDTGPTMTGMIPPSTPSDAASAAAPTPVIRVEPSGANPMGPVSAVAPTLFAAGELAPSLGAEARQEADGRGQGSGRGPELGNGRAPAITSGAPDTPLLGAPGPAPPHAAALAPPYGAALPQHAAPGLSSPRGAPPPHGALLMQGAAPAPVQGPA